jgi:phage terminase large subunit-like protein
MANKKLHPAEQYAADVRSGKVVACHWVRQAVERYYNDLDNAVERGWVFSRKAAERKLNFISKLRHVKGKWAAAGDYIALEPWQQFIVWNLFGWLMADTMKRRFTEAYIEVARKNGKSTLASAISLAMGYADDEYGAEIYYAATTRDQARICFNDAKRMVERCSLRGRSVVTQNAFSFDALGTTHKPVSSEAGNLDGLSASCVILDEFHAHPTDELYGVLQTSSGSREQPLMFIITTAGLKTTVPCYTYRKTMTEVLDGVLTADRTFAIIYTLDDPAEVDDPTNWAKANPCLGVSLNEAYIRDQYDKMKREPSAIANIMTKHFNVWMNAAAVWIPDAQWSSIESVVPMSELDGKKCVAALDLAAVNDYCSLCLLFNERGRYQYLWKFYIPEDKYNARHEILRENANIDEWVAKGYVTVTEGNVTDYDYILADFDEMMQRYDITTVAYDPWNAAQVASKLTERGATLQPFTQTIGNFAYPTKEFARIVGLGIVDHYDNPVARWMLSNVVIKQDVNGNARPDKAKSAEKIDGIVAAIMALGQFCSDNGEGGSVYERRGLLGFDEEDNDNNYDSYDDEDY